MFEMQKVTVRDQIRHEREVARCPRCNNSCGLTVYGYLGRPGRMSCPCGHDFAVPPPFDANQLLTQAVAGRDEITELTFGALPNPDSFR